MAEIPPEEQYETDTIFSQEGDVPDSYLQLKLRDLDSDHELFSDNETNLKNERFVTIDLPSPKKTTKVDSDSFRKLVEESKFVWGNNNKENGDGDGAPCSDFDRIVFHDEIYDMSQDSFRYGRVTTGTSYNLFTGKMPNEVAEKVKEKDEENDEEEELFIETVTEDEKTHLITTEVTIPLNGSGDGPTSFDQLYDSQMPKFFKYRDNFPEIYGIWTLLFDQEHYGDMSTFELQASICAALNSKHQLIICIGVDSYNSITGVEMSATDRVVFRMALTRAVAGEFQPPLIKVPPKQLTGVSPMKRDVSEMTSNIDVLFIPVLDDDVISSSSTDSPTSRFLIVVRVKEITDKLYQLSSGRIYVEENGRVVELSSINEAFSNLIIGKMSEKPSIGSVFMLEPEPFVEDSQLEIDECESSSSSGGDDEEVMMTDCGGGGGVTEKKKKPDIIVARVQNIDLSEDESTVQSQLSKISESVLSRLDTPQAQNIGWFLFATAVAFGIYQTVRTRF